MEHGAPWLWVWLLGAPLIAAVIDRMSIKGSSSHHTADRTTAGARA